MGQIIRLAVPPAGFPDTSEALDPAERVLLIAIRWWAEDDRPQEDPLPRFCQALDAAGTSDAGFSVDRLMSIIADTVVQPIKIHTPSCPDVSNDEKRPLQAAGLAQAGDDHLAEKALRAALLSTQGAECALDPLRGLAELLAEAGLFFRRRRPLAVERAADEVTPPRETIR